MNYEKKLKEKGYSLPTFENKRVFESAVQTGNLLFVSGHAAKEDGDLIHKGIVGSTVTLEEAQECAKIAFLNCLAAVRNTIGTIDNIKKIVNVKGYIASSADFVNHPQVMDELSLFINDVFGENGKHSRVSMGLASLPGGTPVEVELVVEIK